MNAAGRLGLYAAGVVVAFAGAYGVSSAVVPQSVVDNWQKDSQMMDHDAMTDADSASGQTTEIVGLPGLSLSTGGFVLEPVDVATEMGVAGQLSLRVVDAAGEPLLDYETSHEKDLHLILVRSDGALFRHVHPVLDSATGTWSVPWSWEQAGTYRVYADFVPAVENGPGKITLSRTVEVQGEFDPVAAQVKTADQVDGFDVTVEGDLIAGASADLQISVSRDGQPVTSLEPYLGAFGHLVALREGDLAYLHVHAQGEEPVVGDTAGPTIVFGAEAPTAGRYLLYLDFQVDGQVHTAEFVLDAAPGDGSATDTHGTDTHGGH